MYRNWQIGITTHQGTRKRSNEDSHFYKYYTDQKGNEIGLFVVADGMGGYQAGNVASKIVIDDIESWWDKRIHKLIKRENVIEQMLHEVKIVVQSINDKIIKLSEQRSITMGTTISLLILYQGEYGIIHIGDSRIYQMEQRDHKLRHYFQGEQNDMLLNHASNETTENLESLLHFWKLTEDHSWVERQVKEGKLPKDIARNHPKRNVLTQCLGIKNTIKPYIKTGIYQTDTLFLLCTDGFYSLFSDEEIKNMLINLEKEYVNLQTMCNYLVNFSNFSKADDNITLFLIRNNYIKREAQRRSFFSFLKF